MNDEQTSDPRSLRRSLAWAVWFLALLAWLGYLLVTHIEGGTGCGNSAGEATWSWFPPGRSCHYVWESGGVAYRHSDHPSHASLLIPAGLAYVAFTLRRMRSD